jgi:site-specific recombinase XerD
MFDLTPFEPGALGQPLAPEIASARRYVDAAQAASTERAYARGWGDFCAWSAFRGVEPLPAHPAAVAMYLSFLADRGLSAASIGQRAAAIAHRHRKAGHDAPTTNPVVQDALRGIRRTVGTAPRRKSAATADRIRAMLDACPDTMIGIRDRALLALGFAGAFRRSELVALQVQDLEEVADGYRVTIRRSKTDQTGEGAEIVIPRGLKIRPVAAVQAWLQAAGIETGYLFRQVHRGGHVRPEGIAGRVVAEIVKQYAERAGLDPQEFSGHSLRAGFVTSAAESGASILKIQETSRHKSTDVLAGYVRRVDMFKDHAGAAFL